MDLDELPVGKGQKFEIPELPPEAPAETTTRLPLKERLKSKNPKIRFEAVNDLLKEIADATTFTDYYPKVQKLLSDTHPGAQEKALDCLLVLLDKCPPNTADDDLITVLIEKCITSAKSSIKTKAVDNFLIIAELPGTHTLIYDTLKNYITTKDTPIKIIVATLYCLNQLLSNFGNGVFPTKEVLKHVVAQAGSTNTAIKTEAMNYLKEAYRWIKDKILPSIESLKPVQQEELKSSFEACVDKAIPKRAIRGQTIKVEEDAKDVPLEDTKEEKKKDFLVAEQTPVLGKFGEKWCSSLVALKKWTEKRDKLEELLKATNVKRIKAENFTELGSTLKKVLNDSNIVVVNTAIKIIGQLAVGLREAFSSYAKQIFTVILNKCKDKKTLATSQKCLEDLVLALKLSDMLDDIKAALTDKSPIVKSKICFWLETVGFSNAGELLPLWTKEFGPILGKLTDDAVSDVRDSALSCLGTLKGLVQDPTLEAMIKEMNMQKQQKIMKSAEGIKRCTMVSAPEEVKEEVKKKTPEKSKPDVIVVEANTVPKKRKPMPKLPSMKAKEAKKEASKPKEVKLEDIGALPTQEEADKIVLEKIPNEITVDFDNLPWKEKQERLQMLNAWLKKNAQGNEFMEAFVIWFRLRLKGFKENNINVIKDAFALLQALTESVVLTKKFASIIVPGLAEKIGDTKLTETCKEIIMGVADSATPTYVVTLLIYTTQPRNNVNVIKALLSLLLRMIEEYTAKLVPLINILDYTKTCLVHSNAQVKVTATKVIMAIYAQVGSDIKPIVASNLTEALYKALEPEFAKTKLKEVELKRKLKGAAEAEMEAKKKVKNTFDGLISRVNISSQITSKLLSDLNSSKRGAREEAKNALEKILVSANNCIQPIGLSPLINALKGRMNEPAKNLAKGFIALVGNLATALGSGFKQYIKIILQPLMWNLADKQAAIRNETIIAMNKLTEAAGFEIVFTGLGPLLEKDNPDLRAEVLNWILKNKTQLEKINTDFLVKPLVEALQDRTKEIRVLAEKVVEIIIESTGYQAFAEAIKDLKPAIKETLVGILNKCKAKDTGPIITQRITTTIGTPERKAHKRTVLPLPKQHLIPSRSIRSEKKLTKGRNALSRSFSSNPSIEDRTLYATVNPKLFSIGQLTAEPIVINPLGNKDKRSEADKNAKWPVTTIRADYVNKLKSTLKSIVNSTVFTCMFSTEMKKNIEALKILSEGVKLDFAAILDVIDLLFKWCTMKLIEQGNVTINRSIADFIGLVFEEVLQSNYILYDFESAAIIPILCEKLGVSNIGLRGTFKSLLKKACDICQVPIIYNYLIQAIDSKNNRTRTEALVMLKEIVNTHGDKTVTSKDIKSLVKMLEDNLVKNEVADYLAEVYRYKGEKIWSMFGTIPDKSKELLKEKFAQMSPIAKESVEEEIKVIEEKKKEEMDPESLKEFIITFLSKKIQEEKKKAKEEETKEKEEVQAAQHLKTIDQCLQALKDKEILKKKDALIALHSIIEDLYKNNKEELATHSNAIFISFSNLLQELFEKPPQEMQIKFGKFFMKLFTEVCSVKLMVSNFNEDTLFLTVEQLLQKCLYEGLSNMGENKEGEAICKLFNSAVSKLLNNSDPTKVFTGLLKLLKKYRNTSSESQNIQQLPILVINCLRRYMKTLNSTLLNINVSSILLSMHECLLENTGIFELNTDGIGVKLIKSILIELVRYKKELIWEDYKTSVKIHPSGDIYLHRWINDGLKSLFPASKGKLNKELKEIFLGFSSKETFENSLKKLSELMNENSEFNVNEYLSSCSVRLRQLIVDGLRKYGVKIETKNEEEETKEPPINTKVEGEQVKQNVDTSDLMARINKYKEEVYGTSNKLKNDS